MIWQILSFQGHFKVMHQVLVFYRVGPSPGMNHAKYGGSSSKTERLRAILVI